MAWLGMQRHFTKSKTRLMASQMWYWPGLTYPATSTLIKTSILVSFKRIFGYVSWVVKAIYIIGVLLISWGIGTFFTVLFRCSPIHKSWLPLRPRNCINMISFLWGHSRSNNLLDWSILLLPVIPVWKMQLEARQKTLVLGAFFLGSL
jgi:hypothetical protein